MDGTVLALYASGLAATTAGSGIGAIDVARRMRVYRRHALDAQVSDATDRLDAIQQPLFDREPELIAWQLRTERAARVAAEARLGAVAGAADRLWRLWLIAGLLLLGVALSGAADILAAVHATG